MLEQLQQEVRDLYGPRLQKIERWAKFRTTETTEKWLELLGPTAVLLSHQEHLVEITYRLLTDLIPPEELTILLLAQAVHDLGELTKGDIPAPIKTEKQEKVEHAAALKLIKQVSECEEIAHCYHEVVMGENAAAHSLFKAIEKSEYVMTAMHVFEKIRYENHTKHDNLWLLVVRVIALDLPKALDYAVSFPDSIGTYFLEQAGVIDRMFVESSWRVTEDFATQFTTSEDKWGAWKKTLSA